MKDRPEKNTPAASVKEKITPKVGGSGKTGKYLAVVTLAIIAVILGRGFFTAPQQNQNKISLEPKITTASSTVPLNLETPIAPVVTPVSPPPELPVPEVPVTPPPEPPSVLPSRNEGITAQTEQTRLKSPTMVYGEETRPNEVARSVAGAPVNSLDPNNTFAQQAANAPVVTVTAKRDTDVNYKILQGKLISAVLETSINSDMPGMVRAVVSKDIYSDTGRIVLLPRGTRLIGQYNSTIAIGQTRVMVMWTRAITPQHVDIALGSPNTDSLGQAGMGGDVDTHFWQIFGNSALLSILGVGASNMNPGSNSGELGVVGNPYQLAVAQGMMNASNNVLQSRINMQPTIRVDQGSAIQVFVARDLDFSGLVKR